MTLSGCTCFTFISLPNIQVFIEQGFGLIANNVDVSMKTDARNDNGDYLKNYSYTQEERPWGP